MTILSDLWHAATAVLDTHPVCVHYFSLAMAWASKSAGILRTLHWAWSKLRSPADTPTMGTTVIMTETTTTTVTVEKKVEHRKAA